MRRRLVDLGWWYVGLFYGRNSPLFVAVMTFVGVCIVGAAFFAVPAWNDDTTSGVLVTVAVIVCIGPACILLGLLQRWNLNFWRTAGEEQRRAEALEWERAIRERRPKPADGGLFAADAPIVDDVGASGDLIEGQRSAEAAPALSPARYGIQRILGSAEEGTGLVGGFDWIRRRIARRSGPGDH